MVKRWIKLSKKDDYLSPTITNTLRGILTLLIVIHHIYQFRFTKIVNPTMGIILQNLGFWCVALFLFLSGYAISYSFRNKKNYMKSFLKNKLLHMILIYIVFIIIYMIFYYLNFNQFKIFRLWFLESIIYMYISSYIFFKNKENYLILLLEMIIYFILCFILKKDISWYATILCFPLGIIWNDYKNKIDSLISNKGIVTEILLFILLFILFRLTFLLSFKVMSHSYILYNILFIISNLLFVLSFFSIFKIICFKNNLLIKLGKYSLEIYAIQFLYLILLKNINIYIYPILVIVLAIISGIVINIFNEKVIKKIIKE